MKLLVRVPLNVENMHALSGFYTDGVSLMAAYGLVSRLEDAAEFEVSRFGLVVEAYEPRLGEKLSTGLDLLPRGKQRDAVRPESGYRYANLRAALYLETELAEVEQQDDLLACLADALNISRFQGGNLVDFVSADPEDPVHLDALFVSHPAEYASFVATHERPLSSLYLTNHLPQPRQGDALVDAYAQALVDRNQLLVCNGYVQVGVVEDAAGAARRIAEPTFTLAETLPVHQLKKLEPAPLAALLPRFFWSFDRNLHAEKPNFYTLH